MKILIINNNTRHLPDLSKSLIGYEVEIRNYQPGLDFNCADKDLIILSGGGGEGLEIHDEFKPGELWYQDQINFIKSCNKPIVGICMGFEVICRAYGAKIELLNNMVEGFVELQATKKGQDYLGKKHLKQFESHEWSVPTVSEDELDILATSKTGIEIVKHKTKRIFATQFHPEKGGTISLAGLIDSFQGR